MTTNTYFGSIFLLKHHDACIQTKHKIPQNITQYFPKLHTNLRYTNHKLKLLPLLKKTHFEMKVSPCLSSVIVIIRPVGLKTIFCDYN